MKAAESRLRLHHQCIEDEARTHVPISDSSLLACRYANGTTDSLMRRAIS